MSRLGPGKYEVSGALGVLFSAVAGDGAADEEAGNVFEQGRWYALFRGAPDLASLKENWAEEWKLLDKEDVDTLLDAKGGVIITEDSQGFVDIDFYSDGPALDRIWNEIEDDMREGEDDEDYDD